ncbi:MAG TPA: DUF5658 family protein [Ktedonobacterales bacterium]
MRYSWPPAITPPVLRPLPRPQPRPPAHLWVAAVRRARALWLWVAVYVALNVADLVSTYIGLHSGLHEGNPLMGSLLREHGFGALIVYKVLVVVAVVAGIHVLRHRHARLAGITLTICNTLVGLAVLLNLLQYALL